MWYDEKGSGEPLLMLHPGGVDSRAFEPNIPAFSEKFHVYLPERRGHGHTADPEGEYSFDLLADDTIAFIEKVIEKPVRILGYSDGSLVGLLVAKKRPDLVTKLICAAGVYHRDGWYEQAIAPVSEAPEFMIAMYADVSPDGKEHLPIVVKKLNEMHAKNIMLTEEDLQTINCQTLVIVSDDDEVKLEHAISFYRALPHGELAVIPGTSHGFIVEKIDLSNKIMLDFLTQDPIQTYAPIHRARNK
ncbi:MAG: alpha/beta hydrolase [Candidatus Levybacteria bacterium]|nr:alpha/beta hydrolase [Candidatus Levybacteria bacterium]